jgi:ferredoxin-NADP reductase
MPAEVVAVAALTPTMRAITLRPQRWAGHRAGQHIRIRLTAPDGYSAQRDYSIASADDHSGLIEIAVDRLPEGEVSPFLHDDLIIGDQIELRGPIGGHFVWEPALARPLLLVAGGSGIVPLRAMLEARHRQGERAPAALIYAARHWNDLAYRDEFLARAAADPQFWLQFALSRETVAHPAVRQGRMEATLLADALAALPAPLPDIFICGSNGFVETAVALSLAAGLPPELIRTERFGGA